MHRGLSVFILGLIIVSITSCKKEDESDSLPVPQAPNFDANSTPRFSISVNGESESHEQDLLVWLNTYGSGTYFYSGPMDDYYGYFSRLTPNGSELVPFGSVTGMEIIVGKKNNSTQLSDSEFLNLFTEGSYYTGGATNQPQIFSVNYYAESGPQYFANGSEQPEEHDFEILDAVPFVTEFGEQGVRVYIRFDADFTDLTGEFGANGPYPCSNAVFVGTFFNF